MPPSYLPKQKHLTLAERRERYKQIREHFEQLGLFKKK